MEVVQRFSQNEILKACRIIHSDFALAVKQSGMSLEDLWSFRFRHSLALGVFQTLFYAVPASVKPFSAFCS